MAITRLQTASNTSSTGTSIAFTWGSNTTAGSALVVVIGHGVSPGLYTGNPTGYAQQGSTLGVTSGFLSVWAALNAASVSSGVNQTFSFTISDITLIAAAEWSGLGSSIDAVGAGNSGAASNPSTGNLVTGAASALIFGGCMNRASLNNLATLSSPTGGFAVSKDVPFSSGSGASTVHYDLNLLEQVVSSTGTYACGLTSANTTQNTWAANLVSIGASGGGGASKGSLLLLGVGN